MAYLLAALLLLALIAGSVTIVDAVRAPHWRVVAVERRRSWRERTDDDVPDDDEPDDSEPAVSEHNDSDLDAAPLSYARG